MHRLGGLEKQDITGNVSYDPENHQHMVDLRQQKVANVAQTIPPQKVQGPEQGKLLVLSWGGTYGACTTAVEYVAEEGKSVAHAHLRYLNPFPSNLGSLLKNYERVLVPELNMGQLSRLIRDRFLIDTVAYNKVQGKPFMVSELMDKIKELV
jgi:2-oxoglutarate ferredoxin oxidoreductase subunit alpha